MGVGGTLANLVRTKSCQLSLDNSLTFAELEESLKQQTFKLIEPNLLLSHLDAVTLTEEDAQKWCQGQLVDLSRGTNQSQISAFTPEHYLVTYGMDRTCLGISVLYERLEILKLKPKVVLVQ